MQLGDDDDEDSAEHAPTAYYVVSSPEMSEAELASSADLTDHPSSGNSTNTTVTSFTDSSMQFSDDTNQTTASGSTVRNVSFDGNSAIFSPDSEDSAGLNSVSTPLNRDSTDAEDR